MAVSIVEENNFCVVVNEEEQYSIWPVEKSLPAGWKDGFFIGTKEQCLDYIEEVWTDMRPLSLRKKLDAFNSNSINFFVNKSNSFPSLVDLLLSKPQSVKIIANDKEHFLSSVKDSYIHVNFMDTVGGTEIGMEVGQEIDWQAADSGNGQTTLRVIGKFELDYRKLEAVIDVDVNTLSGIANVKECLV